MSGRLPGGSRFILCLCGFRETAVDSRFDKRLCGPFFGQAVRWPVTKHGNQRTPKRLEMVGVMRNRLLGLSPQVLERTERIGEKCGRIGRKCRLASPQVGGRETAQTPANKGPKRKTPPRASCPRERGCILENGGGGGNRTRVRKCFHERIYVRSLSFRSSPPARASGALTPAARRLSVLPGQPPSSRVGARCRRPVPLAGGHGGDGRPLLGRQRQVVVGSY